MATDPDKDYITLLLSDGVSTPVEKVTDSCKLHLPDWFDEAKFKRAQQFYRRNVYAIVIAVLYGAVAVMALPSVLNVLMFTKRSSSVLTAYRRYMATILYFVGWYTEDLKPGTRVWKSIESVRRAHSSTSKRTNLKIPGMTISQRDMVVVQYSFVGYCALSPRMLGLQYSTADMEAFIHFWRVIGYMLGIEDRFNCCTADPSSSRIRMQQIQDQLFLPALSKVGEDFHRMSKYMLDGMWYFNVFLNPDAILYMTYRLNGVPGYGYPDKLLGRSQCAAYEKLSWYSRAILWILVKTHDVNLSIAPLRWFHNALVSISVNIGIPYFPLPAIVRFGYKNAVVRI
ncbi:uncharacterized protein LOC135707708 [Ochlerotatus camptorhynchus]|uniref:uncharacterized protein LOC135707708 n=1 Tax=Ochlerotatus camptorhynchus TaxID=644619 RepID=UPI0031E3E690